MYLTKANPKIQFIFFLLLFFIITSFRIPFVQSLYILALCVGFSALADVIFAYMRKKKFFIPYSAVITGLILALIVDPYAAWFQILVICSGAIGIKNFLRISGKHIFNPAAIGLLTGWLVFGTHPSWWGASLYTPGSFTIPNLLIYLSLMTLCFVSCYRYKRFYTVISFLLVFMILRLLITPSTPFSSVFSLIISPGMLFYTVVMVVEPLTSPINKLRQVLYGLVIALVYISLVSVAQQNTVEVYSYLPDISIVSLLIGNVLFFKYR